MLNNTEPQNNNTQQPHLEPNFKKSVAKAFVFSLIGTSGAKLFFMAAILVVLKIISKEEFGIANIVLAIFAITESINEMGLGVALVQKDRIKDSQISALFWLSFFISLTLYPILFFSAPIFAHFYGVDQLSELIRVYGVVLIIYALNLVPRNMLIKNLQFKQLALIDNISILSSSGIMIFFAWRGYGAFSIVFGDIANRFFQFVGCYIVHPFIPKFNFKFSKIKDMFFFGAYATGSKLLYNLYTHSDYLIVGKVFGLEALGIYTLAYRMIADPVRALAGVVNQVAYPTFSKLQHDKERLEKYFFTIARFSLLFVSSILVVVVVFMDWILSVGGYEKWLDAVPIAYIFAGVGIVRSISPLIPQLLNAMGQAKKNFIYSLCMVIGMPLSFLVASQISLMAVAWAWTVVYPLMVLILIFFGAAIFKQSVVSFTLKFYASLPAVGLIALLSLLIKFLAGNFYDMAPIIVTIASILLSTAVLFGIVFLKERTMLLSLFKKGGK